MRAAPRPVDLLAPAETSEAGVVLTATYGFGSSALSPPRDPGSLPSGTQTQERLDRICFAAPAPELLLLHTIDLVFSDARRQSVTGAGTNWIRQKPPSHGLGLSWQ